MRRARVVLAVLLVPLVGAPARAQGTPDEPDDAGILVDHSSVPDAGCLTTFELQRRVEQRTGPLDRARREGRRVQVLYRLAGEGSGFVVEVRVFDVHGAPLGERRLKVPGSDCSRADEAVVLITATLFGLTPPLPPEKQAAEAPTEQPNPPLPDDSTLGPTPETSVAPPPAPKRAERPVREPWSWHGVVAPGVSSGVTPRPAASLTLGASVLRSRMALGLFGDALPRSRRDLGGGAKALFHAAWIRAQLCGRVVDGIRARAGLCVGLRGGFVQASTQGLPQQAPVWSPEVGALVGCRLLLGRQRRRAQAFIAADLAIPLIIQRFWVAEADGQERLYHESHPGLWLSVGLSLGARS